MTTVQEGSTINMLSIEFLKENPFWLNVSLVAFATVVVLLLITVYYLLQSGLMKNIIVETRESPYDEMTVAYKTGRGPYKGAASICTEVQCIMKSSPKVKDSPIDDDPLGKDNPLMLGLYYDDPESAPEDELRFAVGAVLSTGSESADPHNLEKMISHGYKIAVFPKPAFVVTAAFPLTTRLSLYIAIFRVYPKLREYISAKGLCAYPAMEFYTRDKIQFVMPLSKQEEFFVPEFSEDQVSIATTEFSTVAPSEANKSYYTGMDDNASASGADSIHDESHTNLSSVSDNYNTQDRRVQEDFGCDDSTLLESDIDDVQMEKELQDPVFIKPTKPAPRKKMAPKTDEDSTSQKSNEFGES